MPLYGCQLEMGELRGRCRLLSHETGALPLYKRLDPHAALASLVSRSMRKAWNASGA